MPDLVPCFGCGGSFSAIEGPTHRYMTSTPGCWQAYGEVLAREYSDPAYGRLHRLTVDSYAVQHPGQQSPQTIQSVAGHLIGLCQVLERGKSHAEAVKAIDLVTKRKGHYVWLDPPPSMGAITVADVRTAQSAEAHLAMVQRWAESAWEAWGRHHDQIRWWIGELDGL